LNAIRFRWHERLIGDPELTEGALRFAGLVLHRFHSDLGFAAIAHRWAAERLGMSPKTILRARDLLLARGWICRHKGNRRAPGIAGNVARYGLSGGPNDLDLEAHQDDVADDSI
jgi:hypothetical protein